VLFHFSLHRSRQQYCLGWCEKKQVAECQSSATAIFLTTVLPPGVTFAVAARRLVEPSVSNPRWNLWCDWRRGRDCSRLRRSSLASARDRRRLKLRRPAPPLGRRLVEPWGSNPARVSTKIKTSEEDEAPSSEVFTWRRGRDSNPRRAFDPYALSRGAPSTTRPPLRIKTIGPSRSAG
jgi:hypothetical protein